MVGENGVGIKRAYPMGSVTRETRKCSRCSRLQARVWNLLMKYSAPFLSLPDLLRFSYCWINISPSHHLRKKKKGGGGLPR